MGGFSSRPGAETWHLSWEKRGRSLQWNPWPSRTYWHCSERSLGMPGDAENVAEVASTLKPMQLANYPSGRRYLKDFESNRKKTSLLEYEGDSLAEDWEARKSIIVTWQISFEHSWLSAADLLSLMSFLTPVRSPGANHSSKFLGILSPLLKTLYDSACNIPNTCYPQNLIRVNSRIWGTRRLVAGGKLWYAGCEKNYGRVAQCLYSLQLSPICKDPPIA